MSPGVLNAAPSLETLETLLDVTYTWGYQDTRAQLRALYDKAVRAQWIADDVQPWHLDVDADRPMGPVQLLPLFGSEIDARMTTGERVAYQREVTAWTLSQFLHGEQGALLAAAQLVNSVPDLDSKLYAGSQVFDEARHVDVYNRYLHGKIGVCRSVRRVRAGWGEGGAGRRNWRCGLRLRDAPQIGDLLFSVKFLK